MDTLIDEYFAYKQKSRVYRLLFYFTLYQSVIVGNEEDINNVDPLCT